MSIRARAVAALAVLAPSTAAAQAMAGEEVRVGSAQEDVYVAGGRVEAAELIEGDLAAVGGSVRVSGPVWGDVLVGGGSVEISGDVRDDVRAAGGEVRVLGAVGDAVALAGGSVEIGSGAQVGGRALIAGGEVRAFGRMERGLRAAGGRVVLGGEVSGDVEVTAEELRILPTARIDGALRYASPRPADVSPEAEVTGGIVRAPLPDEGPGAVGAIVFGLLWMVGLALLGLALLALLPGASAEALRLARAEPGKALGVGLATLVVTPLVAGVAAFSVAGTPLALVTLALWLVLLLVGYVAAAAVLGDAALVRLGREPTRGARFLALLGALVVLRLLRLVPFLGAFVLLAAAILGMGAIVVAAARRRAPGRAAPPGSPPVAAGRPP